MKVIRVCSYDGKIVWVSFMGIIIVTRLGGQCMDVAMLAG